MIYDIYKTLESVDIDKVHVSLGVSDEDNCILYESNEQYIIGYFGHTDSNYGLHLQPSNEVINLRVFVYDGDIKDPDDTNVVYLFEIGGRFHEIYKNIIDKLIKEKQLKQRSDDFYRSGF